MNRFTTFVSCRNPICLVHLERFRLLAIPQSNSCLAQHDPTLTLENFPVGTDPNLSIISTMKKEKLTDFFLICNMKVGQFV
ncbi:hypothetical protein T07_7360 [Trichinella nelsoni]|uniref:Uncharacterized protein n=1 Tax=Trichinella nelsoni TaxID=6336 RepID=A0A0V0SJX6_9BILA|nr:hypothetical protein T07_7360 [Trichinella nelsoni]